MRSTTRAVLLLTTFAAGALGACGDDAAAPATSAPAATAAPSGTVPTTAAPPPAAAGLTLACPDPEEIRAQSQGGFAADRDLTLDAHPSSDGSGFVCDYGSALILTAERHPDAQGANISYQLGAVQDRGDLGIAGDRVGMDVRSQNMTVKVVRGADFLAVFYYPSGVVDAATIQAGGLRFFALLEGLVAGQ